MMQTDVKSAYKAGTGAVYIAPTRVKGIFVDLGAGAGTLELSDGASGDVLFKITTAASPTQNPVYIPIPGEGIKFSTSVYTKTATNVTSVTVFYG